jgi:hypothetical protein
MRIFIKLAEDLQVWVVFILVLLSFLLPFCDKIAFEKVSRNGRHLGRYLGLLLVVAVLDTSMLLVVGLLVSIET